LSRSSQSRVLYIGQSRPGTTSYSRGNCLRELLPGSEFAYIDTLTPFYDTSKIFRSIGFRWKWGPLIRRLNRYVLKQMGNNLYDLVWVDKAVFLTETTTKLIRQRTKKLVHFTPDPAFTFHLSKHFERSLSDYDLLVTTKHYEVEMYASRVGEERTLLVTQGYDPSMHYSRKSFADRIPGVCFIGHHEPERQQIIEAILQRDIPVFIAGRGWGRWSRTRATLPNLQYGGEGVYGEEYGARLSEYQFGLGLLSKWVPETHTSRTFEIPACGALLATESTVETAKFFNQDQALFFKSIEDLIGQLEFLIANQDRAEVVAESGLRCLQQGSYDYKSIVGRVLMNLNQRAA